MRHAVRERQLNVRNRVRSSHLASLRLPSPMPLAQAQRTLPWRAVTVQALSAWVATRVAYAVLTVYFPLVTGGESPSVKPINWYAVVSQWTNWDGIIYIHIAQSGYYNPYTTVNFPLYPGAIRAVATLIGFHWTIAALLVSNLSALLAFCGIAALAAQIARQGEEVSVARYAVILFAAYPLAFFLVAAYSDGLFAGLAALTLLFGLRRRWGWAALFGLLAALCRPIAPALILPLAWEAFQRFRERHAESSVRQALTEMRAALAACAAPIAGIGVYSAWLWLRFGDPWIFVSAETHWAHMSLPPALSIPVAILALARASLGSPLQWRILLDLTPILGGLIITLVAARRAPLAFTLYLLAMLYLVTSAPLNYTDVFVSGGRYMLAAVPVFIVLAHWLRRSESPFFALCLVGFFTQAALAIFFLRHGWIV